MALPDWEQLLEAPRPVRDNEVALVRRDDPRTIFASVTFGASNSTPLPDVILLDQPPYSIGWLLAYAPVSQ